MNSEPVPGEQVQTADALKTNALNAHLTSAGPTKDLLSAAAKSEVTLHRIESKRSDTGAHYTIFGCPEARGMDLLRLIFPDGEANEMNFVLFSTSGVHGTYGLIEDCEPTMPDDERRDDVTFLIVHPRIVCLKYGNCEPKTPEDFAFLKKLRASSWAAVSQIGSPGEVSGAVPSNGKEVLPSGDAR